MNKHKFSVGARVEYRPPLRHMSRPTAEYVVARLLPADAEGRQYRIECRADGHQRVVHEIEISKSTAVL